MVNGDATAADFANSLAGSNVLANQSGFDALDNGQISTSGRSTTVSTPSWTQSLQSIFGIASQVATTAGQVGTAVNTLTGKTTAPATNQVAGTPGSTSTTSTILYVIAGALALGALLWFILRK